MNQLTVEAQKKELTHLAANLLCMNLSTDPSDYKFRVPKYHMREIEKYNEKLRCVAIRLSNLRQGL